MRINKQHLKAFLIILWLIPQLLRALFGIVTYDEANFLAIAVSNSGMFGNWSASNFEGFGVIFWLIYTSLVICASVLTNNTEGFKFIVNGFDATRFFDNTEIFGTPHIVIISLRVIVIILSLVFILDLYKLIEEQSVGDTRKLNKLWNYGIMTILVLSPIYWWAGKVASPEYFATFFAGFGMLNWLRDRPKKSLLYFAVAASFKLSILPIIFGIFASKLIAQLFAIKANSRRKVHSGIATFVFFFRWFVLPFVALNPSIFFASGTYFKNLPNSSINLQNLTNLGTLRTILNDLFLINYQTWDLVSIRGFIFWSGVFLLPLAFLSAYLQRRMVIFFFISFISFTSFAITGVYFYPWYEFPLIVTLITLSILINEKSNRPGNLLTLTKLSGIVLLALMIPFSVRASMAEISLNVNWYKDLKSSEQCAKNLDQMQGPIDLVMISKSFVSTPVSYLNANALLEERIKSKAESIEVFLGASSEEKYIILLKQNGYYIKTEKRICGTVGVFNFYRLSK